MINVNGILLFILDSVEIFFWSDQTQCDRNVYGKPFQFTLNFDNFTLTS
jgi:hypothetical protein